MSTAQKGDTVRVHYTGTLADGEQFDSSRGGEPLEFTLGEGNIIPGFETAVAGLTPGDSCQTQIEADDAYGPHRAELLVELPRTEFPEDLDLSVGQTLQLNDQEGNPVMVRVAELGEEAVRLDANHPLAGQALNFDIELVEIV
ncbi:MAG TPA: peptidylprolyl isomerase [Pseudomonadales bacterium]|nr:peptidylprolyl isomerase [Pseudomonadales bacterium]